MIRKLILTVGILGALAAAEGLNRFGGLVSAFGGVGAPFYIGMLIVSVLGAAVFLLVLIREIESRRQVGRLCRVCCLFRLDAQRAGLPGEHSDSFRPGRGYQRNGVGQAGIVTIFATGTIM